MSPSEASDPIARRDALASRLFEATLGLMDLGAVHIGDRLGLYRAPRAAGTRDGVRSAGCRDAGPRSATFASGSSSRR